MGDTSIAGFARQGGVGVETVRYYQRRGLLPVPEQPESGGSRGGIRRYGAEDLRRLRFIRAAQAAGFTLQQIGTLMALDATADRAEARRLARQQVATLDAKIAALQAARDALSALAEACAGPLPGPCPILTAFEGR